MGSALPLTLNVAEVVELEEALGQAMGLGADQDLARSGEAEQPGTEVRGVADGRVVHPEVLADRPHEHEPGVDAHAHAELHPVGLSHLLLERREPILDGERGADGAMGVVLVGDRRAEQRHHTIAEELVDGPLVAVDGLDDDLERPVHDRVDLLGVQALRHRREAGDVAEHDRHLLPLSLDGGPLLRIFSARCFGV